MTRSPWRLALLGALLLGTASLPAQTNDAGAGGLDVRRGRGQRPGRDPGALPDGIARRAAAEQAVREAFAQTVKERLGLTDDQAVRLRGVNGRFAEERIGLMRDEFRLRRELRRALAGGDSTRSPQTATLLDGLLDIQRRRLDVQQREQQALADFLTPEQRARYLALQDQLRRRVQARLDSARTPSPDRAGGFQPPP